MQRPNILRQRSRQHDGDAQQNSGSTIIPSGSRAKRKGRNVSYSTVACLFAVAVLPLGIFFIHSPAHHIAVPTSTHLRLSEHGTSLSPPVTNDNDGMLSKDSHQIASIGGAKVTPRVFIGIKTGEGPSGHRFTQARRTWLQDALDEASRGRVDIKFFTRDVNLKHEKLSHNPVDLNLRRREDVRESLWNDTALVRSIFVPTNCSIQRNLLCGTSALFKYYLDRHGNGTYFCSFDDDQYVIIRNLLRTLDEYDIRDPWRGQNIYVGKPPRSGKVKFESIPTPVSFLTGGAGYCLSRDLVERGSHMFTDLGNVWRATADDCAVGLRRHSEARH